jgi:predicted LPLAT superfamily acyltransferase/uncharacterized protein (DUF2062 family)
MQLRFLICIPVYNHPNTVCEVINKCLVETNFSILVVDDGSTYPVEKQFLTQHAVDDRVSFVTLDKNYGKGYALQTAFKNAIKLGYTHLITVDADGQHPPHEISKLVKASYENPWALVIGDRQMQTQNVPKSSVFGKAFSNFWVKYQTDSSVGDSQSGFRVYPLFFLQTMKFLTKKYDFEIEVITRLVWLGVDIKATPVDVIYFPPEKRVTHFNKFRDNLRLTILNTILVSASLLKRKDSAAKSALATGLGVFIGCLPVYGLHTLIVALLSFLFRMNFIYLWLGTQISIPPMIPVLVAGAYYASSKYFAHAPTGVFALSEEWIVGILFMATAAGLFFGLLVYLIKVNLLRKDKNRTEKVSVKSSGGLGIDFMKWVLNFAGLKPAYFFLFFIVPYYYVFSFRGRRSASQYWQVTHPHLGFFSRQKKILHQLFVFAQVLVDRSFQKASDTNEFRILEGPDVPNFFTTIKNTESGHIALLSHIGGWEIAMTYFQRKSYNKKMVAVMYGQEGSYQHSSMKEQEKQLQVALFNQQQGTVLGLKQALDRHEVVGIMGDRPVGRSYELIPFFGHLALFDSTSIRLMLMCRSELSFIFCVKESTKEYYINCLVADTKSPEFLALTTEEKTILLLTQYSQAIEKSLKRAPEQWFNFFPFWSEKLF